MKTLQGCIITCGALMLIASTCSQLPHPDCQASRPPLIADVKASTVIVIFVLPNGNIGSCTGTSIEYGIILTAAHCIPDDEDTPVFVSQTNDEADYVETFARYKDKNNDIGLLFADIDLPSLSIAKGTPYRVGDPAVVVGHSLRFWYTSSAANISSLNNIGGVPSVQVGLDGNATAGNSGAAIVDYTGQIVGLICFYPLDRGGFPVHSMAFGPNSTVIRKSIERMRPPGVTHWVFDEVE